MSQVSPRFTRSSRVAAAGRDHAKLVKEEQARQDAQHQLTAVRGTFNVGGSAKPVADPASPWAPDGRLLARNFESPPAAPTPPPPKRRAPNRVPLARRAPKPAETPPPSATTAQRFTQFLTRQTDSHRKRDECIANENTTPRAQSAMNSNSARILQRASPRDNARPPADSPGKSPVKVSTPRRRSSVAGERRLRLEIAQTAAHELRVEVMRTELAEESKKQFPFSPTIVSRPPSKSSRPGVKSAARPPPAPVPLPAKNKPRPVPRLTVKIGEMFDAFGIATPKKRARSVQNRIKPSK
jgi:hypothetical protein